MDKKILMEKLKAEGRQGIEREAIENYQKKMYEAGLANIPISYARFLEEVNGVKYQETCLFGITDEQHDEVPDLYNRNSIQGTPKQNEKLFLGYNFNEYLCYNWNKKSYEIIDKEKQAVEKEFKLFDFALAYFFRDE